MPTVPTICGVAKNFLPQFLPVKELIMARTRMLFALLAVAVLVLGLPLAAQAQSPHLKGAMTGAPEIKSIEAISFGPDGLLLIGDGKGSQVVAIDTGDTKGTSWTKKEIPNLKDEVAGRLGTMAKNIEIRKLAVNPASQVAYLVVRQLSAKKDVLLTVNGDGKIAEFPLDNVKYITVSLQAGEKAPMKLITDITWAGDRILVAAQASETFNNTIVSIPTPLHKDSATNLFTTKTYHVGHSKWETQAPLRVIIPYEENGKKYLVGSFTCTPIVKYSLEDVKPGAQIEGISVIELGQGNTPQDMFTYKKNGKTYILMNNFRMAFMQKNNPVGPSPYWTAKVDQTILQELDKINQKAIWRTKGKASESQTDFATVVPEYHYVTNMDRLNEDNALVIRTDDKGGLSMAVLPLP
jgi:hypothetical protein